MTVDRSELRSAAPKEWRGRPFEDFDVGDVCRSRLGRTISEADNTWFTCLTMNTNQVHFNAEFAAGTRFGSSLVNSCLSENGTANLRGAAEVADLFPTPVDDWAD